jgi:hypothetical protein
LGGYSRGAGALTDAARDRVRLRHVRAGVGGAGGGWPAVLRAPGGHPWAPQRPIDFDFLVGGSFDKVLAGEFLDKVSSLFFTIGVTLHW